MKAASKRKSTNTCRIYKKRKRVIPKKKEKGIIKPIKEMKSRGQRRKRRGWRKSSKEYYRKKKEVLKVLENVQTPPTSPEVRSPPQQQVARQLGRKKVRKDRSKAYRDIFRLQVALKREETLKKCIRKDTKGIVYITTDQKKKMLLLKVMTSEKQPCCS